MPGQAHTPGSAPGQHHGNQGRTRSLHQSKVDGLKERAETRLKEGGRFTIKRVRLLKL